MAALDLLGYFLLTSIALFFLSPLLLNQNNPQAPIVQAPIGDISGTCLISKKGRNIFAYQGIPYAKSPSGELRFKRPQSLPEKAWQGVFDGTKSVTKCVQISEIPALIPVNGKEDCLQLNVYVPESKNPLEEGFPVMVWFHGGGFTAGDSSTRLYGPEFLLDKDVILVTVNYRLGIFGFLTLGIEEISGNQGMWDQLESLKWVQKNIAAFGGDPNKVTIFGESAGGYSVSHHLTSHQSKGYFSAAIIQSGPLEQAYKPKEVQRSKDDIHKEFSMKMGCPFHKNDPESTVKCLQEKPVVDLMKGLQMFDQCNTLATGSMAWPLVWSPAQDDFMYTKEPFFLKNPVEIMANGEFNQVPTMIGSLKDEGLLSTATMMQNPPLFDHFKKHWDECAANSFLNMFFLKEIDQSTKDKIQQIEKFYLKNEEIYMNHWTFENLSYAFGDTKFFVGSAKMAEQLSTKVKTYFYQFDHLGSFSLSDIFSSSRPKLLWTLIKKAFGIHESKKLGVCHADDLLYLFKSSLPVTILPDEKDQKMVDLMVELWANFATFHDPTPLDGKWKTFADNGGNYVILKNAQILAQTDPDRSSRLDFWKSLNK